MIFFWNKKQTLNNLERSKLFDETSFYKQFIEDLLNCKKEVIIESPYITSSRMELLTPIFKMLVDKGIKVHIVTRDPIEHDEYMQHQATNEILNCCEIGVNITLLRGNHHRKLAIIDREILWEGSLNILSQNNSREIMRRIERKALAIEMLSFLNLQ
ncbi:MAG: hypothetical protein RI947_606 [Candidatus Parcubacteria bacterium]|jgi:phosphatidylserine/phosphatidylglycerophosphate/cardiolipin synthase-like enzyme